MHMKHSSPLTYARAKHMRREPTSAEQRLWAELRNRRLAGFKFYRQVPIGSFIVDFISKEFGVVVEVDGATHGDDNYDQRRTQFLEAQGFVVLRVGNLDVSHNMAGVKDAIVAALTERVPKGPHQPFGTTMSTL